MPRKTNKTSRVLDLLTNGDPPDPAVPQKVTVEVSENDKLSSEILTRLEKLEREQEEQNGAEEASHEEAPVKTQAPGEPSGAAQIKTQTPVKTPPEVQPHEENFLMISVIERLFERQNLNDYLERYDVCKCGRCRADISAYVLTQMPSKYVVVGRDEVNPYLGYYEGKYRMRMYTELIKACMIVKENPRH